MHRLPEGDSLLRPHTAAPSTTSKKLRHLQRQSHDMDRLRSDTVASSLRRRVEDVQAHRERLAATNSEHNAILDAIEARRLQHVGTSDRLGSCKSFRKGTRAAVTPCISGLRKQQDDEVEKIRQAFERQQLAFSRTLFERALFVPEDHLLDDCVKRLPVAGSKLPENPLLVQKRVMEKSIKLKQRKPKRKRKLRRKLNPKKRKKKPTVKALEIEPCDRVGGSAHPQTKGIARGHWM
ncbi:hypothetical protein ACHHYP_03657 [Achlya hypogyna]|uniref:Uncharacterized protein n=1 Tax=Achlya hypogyna TaxID=1202772 RepID=A0A1V9Z3B7_ACHHY|nr:hypothetical protein ACHHYP_03657 [Achlya hypogyna]